MASSGYRGRDAVCQALADHGVPVPGTTTGPGPDWRLAGVSEQLDTPYRVYSGASWLLAFALGCTAVWIRWHLERSKRRPGSQVAIKRNASAEGRPSGFVSHHTRTLSRCVGRAARL